jgi:hypothetical protein
LKYSLFMYVTHKGKTYLKWVLLRNANAILASGKHLLPPVGVKFEGPKGLYVVTSKMPQPRYFKAAPTSRDGSYTGEPLTAIVVAVVSIVDLPSECPPPEAWECFGAR